jgi:hypothetical protein
MTWRHLVSCFWLIVPALALDAVYAGSLPPPLSAEEMGRDIPLALSVPENVLRAAVVLLPLMMPLEARSPRQRAGLALHALGLAAYAASWAALILAPRSAWSTSFAGLLAPAYTPALWLTGIALVGERTYFERVPYRPWMYVVVSLAFVAFHVAHTALVVLRAGGT